MIRTKRICEPVAAEDGFRILVDKLWPRGIEKDKVKVDLWMKEIAPSDTLREWFSHDPKKWEQFKRRYEAELKDKQELLHSILGEEKRRKTVTLLYSAREEEYNNAVALSIILQTM